MKRRIAKRSRRAPLRAGPTQNLSRIILCLWSVNGDPVERFEAWGNPVVTPSVCVHERIRYDKVERQQEHARIVHYQTRTIIPRLAQAVA